MAIYNEQEDQNVIDNSCKNLLIKDIEAIIEDYGSFGLGEVEADSNPVIESRGNLTHLVERVIKGGVEVYVYGGWDNSVDSYTVSFKELDEDVLRDVLELCLVWEEINTEV